MWIYWKDMQPRKERPLIDNTDKLVIELQQRVTTLEKKLSEMAAKLKQYLWVDGIVGDD